MKSYILGDDKYVYEMVSCLLGKATVPMVITIKGKIDNNNLKGDLNKQPLIDMEFIKRLEKIMGKM